MDDVTKFHDAIANTIEGGLRATFLGSAINRETCMKLYSFIFNTVVDVFMTAGMNVSNDFVNYTAQEFYLAIEINGSEHQLDRNIFTKMSKLDDIKTVELHLLAMLFRGTDCFFPIFQEIKRRS